MEIVDVVLYDFPLESVVAAFGTFTVKLPKNYFGLGITFIGRCILVKINNTRKIICRLI